MFRSPPNSERASNWLFRMSRFLTFCTRPILDRLPAQAVLVDKAREAGVPEGDLTECVETFTVNTKFVGVLRSISGAERLLTIDAVLDDYLPAAKTSVDRIPPVSVRSIPTATGSHAPVDTAFEKACFYITPIGSEGSDQRKHSDLFMGALVEPALVEFNLRLVRADQIGDAGMITGQIIEHIIHSKLVIVDLSFHNPNAFYELALRHAVGSRSYRSVGSLTGSLLILPRFELLSSTPRIYIRWYHNLNL